MYTTYLMNQGTPPFPPTVGFYLIGRNWAGNVETQEIAEPRLSPMGQTALLPNHGLTVVTTSFMVGEQEEGQEEE